MEKGESWLANPEQPSGIRARSPLDRAASSRQDGDTLCECQPLISIREITLSVHKPKSPTPLARRRTHE